MPHLADAAAILLDEDIDGEAFLWATIDAVTSLGVAAKDWMKLAGLRAACFKGCGRRPKLIRAKWNEELRAYSVLPSARGPTAGGIPHCSRCCAGGCLGFDAGGKQDRVAEGDDACCVHCKAQSERYSSDNVQPSFSVLLSSRRG